jgi:hypothetical protein
MSIFEDYDETKWKKMYSKKCDKPAASLNPRRGEYFSCVLLEGHEGECRPGGNCFKHGEYVGEPNKPPKCPHWPNCVMNIPQTDSRVAASMPLTEAVGELEVQPDVLASAKRVAALLDKPVWLTQHGPDSVVFNWTDGKDNLYLTVSKDQIAALLSSPEKILLRG